MENLAPEILGLIFSCLHKDLKSSTMVLDERLDIPGRSHGKDDGDGTFDRQSGSSMSAANQYVVDLTHQDWVFPYTIARVCTRWHDICASHSAFWTRIVLYVDKDHTTLEDAARYLDHSVELPIDIIITRRPSIRWGSRSVLRQRVLVHDFMGLIMPHLYRCRSLHIDVTMSSSLPSIGLDFQAVAPRLNWISLISDFDDMELKPAPVRPYEVNWDIPRPERDEFETSPKGMILDGQNFLNLNRTRRLEFWFLCQKRLQYLTVSGFRPVQSSPPDSMTDDGRLYVHHIASTVGIYAWITSLTLQDLEVTVDTSRSAVDEYDMSDLEELCLDRISARGVSEFFRITFLPNLQSLDLSECFVLDGDIFLDIHSNVPVLAISRQTAAGDMQGFLDPWLGSTLIMKGILTAEEMSSFFSMFANPVNPSAQTIPPNATVSATPNATLPTITPSATTPPTNTPPSTTSPSTTPPNPLNTTPAPLLHLCPLMDTLVVSFSGSLDGDHLVRFLRFRNADVDYEDPEWQKNTIFGPAIKCLAIDGDMHFSGDDEEWCRKRLAEFNYSCSASSS